VEAAAVAAVSATFAASAAALLATLTALLAKLFRAPNPKGMICYVDFSWEQQQ
jgi:hypothetical protein